MDNDDDDGDNDDDDDDDDDIDYDDDEAYFWETFPSFYFNIVFPTAKSWTWV